MKLCNRYNIPQETINQMVKDGVISCTWPMYEEIYTMFESRKGTKSKEQIYMDIAEMKNMSPRTVRYMIEKIGKI